MTPARFSSLFLLGVIVFAFVLSNQVVVGDETNENVTEAMYTNATILDDVLDEDGNMTMPVEPSAVPSTMPVLPSNAPSRYPSGAPSPAPTFKEGDAPVAFQPGDINQPVFESPVAPPLISENGDGVKSGGMIAGTWIATTVWVAVVLAAEF